MIADYKVDAIKGLNQFVLQTANLNPGMYAYRISFNDKAIIKKFVKIKN